MSSRRPYELIQHIAGNLSVVGCYATHNEARLMMNRLRSERIELCLNSAAPGPRSEFTVDRETREECYTDVYTHNGMIVRYYIRAV